MWKQTKYCIGQRVCLGLSPLKESACNAVDLSLICGLGDPLEDDVTTHFNILAWRIPMDREAWQSLEFQELDTSKQPSTTHKEFAHFFPSHT